MLKEGQHVPGSFSSRQVLPTSQTGTVNARVNGNTSATSSSAQAARVHFPYAILEIKLKDGDSCPDWVLVRVPIVSGIYTRVVVKCCNQCNHQARAHSVF
jgi:hypothetical protein